MSVWGTKFALVYNTWPHYVQTFSTNKKKLYPYVLTNDSSIQFTASLYSLAFKVAVWLEIDEMPNWRPSSLLLERNNQQWLSLNIQKIKINSYD